MFSESNVQDYLNAIGNVIKKLQKEQNYSQNTIVDKCRQNGFNISQSTISSIINGKGDIRLYTIMAITSAFDIGMDDFFLMVEDVIRENEINNPTTEFMQQHPASFIITNPADSAFYGFLGDYYTYFYRTTGTEKELVRGELNFSPSSNKKKCIARLKLRLKPDEYIKKSSEEDRIDKLYEGEMFISQKMRVVYCYLYNDKAGEACMLIFKHWYILQSSLKCTMALAITTSSGANRLPTVHRMCLSRKKIYPDKMEYVKGQLLLNDANIILTGQQVEELLNDCNLPDTFKELLKKSVAKDNCAYIQETSLYDNTLSEDEQIKWISYVRAHSSAPKYNKISRRTEEALFSLLEHNNDNSS